MRRLAVIILLLLLPAGVVYASPDTERLAPDGETFTLTNLSGVYTNVDDDPDSPDGEWLTTASNNNDTGCLASFPTPSGNPTQGAGVQEFRVLFRQFDEAQGGTPEGRIELWENGVLIRAGSDTAIPDGGLVVSFTWNANELGTADGSLVECNAVGTKSGGSPGNRNSTEVGAIEWNVEYTAGAVPPTVTTQAATNVEATTATGNGNITATGGENCTIRGFQWGTSPGSYSTNVTESGNFGTGAYTLSLTSLPTGWW